MSALINILGETFGRLTVIGRASSRRRKGTWLCLCECGDEDVYLGIRLRSGKTRSCGCLQKELLAARKFKHGATRRGQRWPEWGVWRTMITRCHNPNAEKYSDYGARGIEVCDRWRYGAQKLTGFQCFIADMGRRPHPELSIERNDNDKGYSPGNCRWATVTEQAQNRRKRKPNG